MTADILLTGKDLDWSKAQINFSDIMLSAKNNIIPNGNITDLLIMSSKNESHKIDLNVLSSFVHFEILSDNQFFINLSGGRLESNLFFLSGQDVTGIKHNSSFTTDTEPSLRTEVAGFIDSISEEMLACFSSDCYLPKAELNFRVMVGDSRMNGSANCRMKKCKLEQFELSAETNDTKSFFEAIVASKVFNPFLTAYIFGEFLSGQRIGTGNKIEF